MLTRIRNAVADALMLFVVPCSIALLPWPLGFAVLKGIARSQRIYRMAADPAWEAARAHAPDCDEREWKYRFRLLRLVDHVDVFLTLLRGKRWRRRYLVESGAWPTAPGPYLFLTYHWGSGNFIWPRMRELGIAAHFIARRASGRALGMTRVSYWFGSFRALALRWCGSAGPIFIGASAGEIASVLDAGHSIVGMLDLPVRPDQRGAEVALLDARARFPVGLSRIGADKVIPIVLFSVGLDLASGVRNLRIETLPAGLSIDATMQGYAAHLDQRLREQHAYWQIWREAPAMFVPMTDAESKTQGIQ